jgi:hypothetical protein
MEILHLLSADDIFLDNPYVYLSYELAFSGRQPGPFPDRVYVRITPGFPPGPRPFPKSLMGSH